MEQAGVCKGYDALKTENYCGYDINHQSKCNKCDYFYSDHGAYCCCSDEHYPADKKCLNEKSKSKSEYWGNVQNGAHPKLFALVYGFCVNY